MDGHERTCPRDTNSVLGSSPHKIKYWTIRSQTCEIVKYLLQLNELRWSRGLVDVLLLGEGEEETQAGLPAHKLLLCGCSPYFNSLFSGVWSEAGAGCQRVTVAGVAPRTLRALVDFMYHGEVTVDEDNASELLVAADLLLMEKLKMALCNFLQKTISASNCVFLSRLADTYSCQELRQSACRFIQRNFEDVCRTEDFLELELEVVEELVSSDNIYVVSEETVVEAVRLWCEGRPGRAELQARLCSHLKLGSLTAVCRSGLAEQQLVTTEQLQLSDAQPGKQSRARGLNKFIVAIAFDSSVVEYLDLDRPEEGWAVLTSCPGISAVLHIYFIDSQ